MANFGSDVSSGVFKILSHSCLNCDIITNQQPRSKLSEKIMHLFIVAGSDHQKAILAREKLVRNNGGMGSSMTCSFLPRNEVVR